MISRLMKKEFLQVEIEILYEFELSVLVICMNIYDRTFLEKISCEGRVMHYIRIRLSQHFYDGTRLLL
jgi:hypothetical protein